MKTDPRRKELASKEYSIQNSIFREQKQNCTFVLQNEITFEEFEK